MVRVRNPKLILIATLTTKAELRSFIRLTQSEEFCSSLCFTSEFVNYVYQHLSLKDKKVIYIYLSDPYELSIVPFISLFVENGHDVFAPVWNPTNRCELLSFRPVFSTNDIASFQKISGIPIPNTLPAPTCPNPDVIFIPALAYDYQGIRLGRGMGHFDNFISSSKISWLMSPPILIGVVKRKYFFSDKLLPSDQHDLRVQYLITDDENLIKI